MPEKTEITLRYDTKCATCGRELKAGTRALYDNKKAYCLGPHLVPGTADLAGNRDKEIEIYKAALNDIHARIQAARFAIDALRTPPAPDDPDHLFD